MFTRKEIAAFLNPYGPSPEDDGETSRLRIVDKHACQIVGRGHNTHYLPALRAANSPADEWLPVAVLTQDGTRLTFNTPGGIFVVHHHDPHALAQAEEYHPGYRILRVPETRGEDGYLWRSALLVSYEPVRECLAES
ncbi:hypothetical protein A0K93_02165 [Corynebacterium sp. BCW_4722]|nr:hypothetical protein A0K93_02165 [Corynebacterium sp. BCW_4722]